MKIKPTFSYANNLLRILVLQNEPAKVLLGRIKLMPPVREGMNWTLTLDGAGISGHPTEEEAQEHFRYIQSLLAP